MTPNKPQLIGSSGPISQIRRALGRLAQSQDPTLITGAVGSGKKLVAKLIHSKSSRRKKPLLVFNCSAIPAALLHGKLFGSVPEDGNVIKGTIDEAEAGTLLIEHIDRLPTEAQGSLLALVLEGRSYRQGARSTDRWDVRLIATSTTELTELSALPGFDNDLAYELGMLHFHLPPLQERKQDIPDLVEHFLSIEAMKSGQLPKVATAEFLERLLEMVWPGNVKQLESAIHTAAVLTEDRLLDLSTAPRSVVAPERDLASDLYERFRSKAQAYRETFWELEARIVEMALTDQGFNQKAAATALGLTEGAIRQKMKRYGIASKRERLRMRRVLASR